MLPSIHIDCILQQQAPVIFGQMRLPIVLIQLSLSSFYDDALSTLVEDLSHAREEAVALD
jgi:hypothetical protein